MDEIALDRRALRLGDVRYFLYWKDLHIDPQSDEVPASHIHGCMEIYLNVSGDVSFLVQNEMYPIERGDIVITRANEFHRCVYHKACKHEHFCLWIEQGEGDELFGFLDGGARHLRLPAAEKERVIALFREWEQAAQKGDKLLESACLLQVFHLLGGEFGQKRSHAGVLPDELQRVLDDVNERFMSIGSVGELCKRFFISPSTLNRWFARYLQESPAAYLEGVRLSAAKRMLDEGKSVTAVCFDCGYCDSSHFIRAFKQKFGCTPGQYKNKKTARAKSV